LISYLIETDVDFFENLVEDGYEIIGVLDTEDHWRLQLEDVVVGTAVAKEDLVLFHSRHNMLRLRRRGYLFDFITNQFDTNEQTDATNIADDLPSFRQLLQLGDEMATDFQRVLLKILAFDHFHHRIRHRAGHGIAAVLKRTRHSQVSGNCSLADVVFRELTVLKYSIPVSQNLRAISGVVMTAATG